MARHGKVSVYKRDSKGRYHFLRSARRVLAGHDIPRPESTRRSGDAAFGRRSPPGTDHTAARRRALERELAPCAPTGTPTVSKAKAAPKTVPGFTRVKDAGDAYIDTRCGRKATSVPKICQRERFEIERWAKWCSAKQHVEELERLRHIAFRKQAAGGRVRREWTVARRQHLMTVVVTMLKHNPLKQVAGLLKPADFVGRRSRTRSFEPTRCEGGQGAPFRRHGGREPADPLLRRHRVPRHGGRAPRMVGLELGREDRVDTRQAAP